MTRTSALSGFLPTARRWARVCAFAAAVAPARAGLADGPETQFPDASRTGPPRGVALKPSGPLVLTEPGAVVSGLDIQGMVTVKASHVVIVNCRIRAASFSVVQIAPSAVGTRVERTEIDGLGAGEGSNGINGEGTFIGDDIHDVENGVNVTGPSLLRDNYIHDLMASGSPHYDGVQIDGGHDVEIVHNTILNAHPQTSAIMIDNDFAPVSHIRVEGNLLGGGGYTVYSDGRAKGGPVEGVAFLNNRLRKGHWGFSAIANNVPVWRGNVDDETGKPIDGP